MPCSHLPPKLLNNMAVCRSVAYVAFVYIVVVLQRFLWFSPISKALRDLHFSLEEIYQVYG